MQSIYDLVTAQAEASYWENLPNIETDAFEKYFPNKKQLGNKLSYIKGKNVIPIAIRPSSFDAKVMIRDRRGVDKVETELPYFKEALLVDETMRQELLMVIATKNQVYIDAVLTKIFDDEMELLRGAKATREAMRAQLLSSGVINIASNGAAYTYDYGIGSNQKETLTSTAKWDDTANSNPIADLIRWADSVEQRTGVRPARAIMRSATFNYIVANQNLAKSIYITNNGAGIVTPTMVKDAIKVLANIEVEVNDKVYAQAGTDGSTSTNYFPANTVTLVPAQALGNTVFGTSPEEADLIGSGVANVKVVDTGVAVTVSKEVDPVNVKTKVSQVVMPSFEGADLIFIATVA